MKKILILFIFVVILFFLCDSTEVKAIYVINDSTLMDGMINNESYLDSYNTDVESELNNAINLMESNNFSNGAIIMKAYELKQTYTENRPFLSSSKDAFLDDAYICSLLAFFSLTDMMLSFELLLQSYIATTNQTYTPYYGYKMNNSDVVIELAHNDSISGYSSFPYVAFNFNKLDLAFSIHNFSYTKTYSTSRSVTIVDVYDFSTDNNFFDNIPIVSDILNEAVNILGYYNSIGFLKTFNVQYVTSHNFVTTYKQCDSTYHYKNCSCGFEEKEEHDFKRAYNNTYILDPFYDVNIMKCSKCNYRKYIGGII